MDESDNSINGRVETLASNNPEYKSYSTRN